MQRGGQFHQVVDNAQTRAARNLILVVMVARYYLTQIQMPDFWSERYREKMG